MTKQFIVTASMSKRLIGKGMAAHPAVQAVTYGPVVLTGIYRTDPGSLTPVLETASVQRAAAQPMTFEAISGAKPARLIPISRAAHESYTVYWQAV